MAVDDVINIIREEDDCWLLHSAGLEDEAELFAPVGSSVRYCGVRLGINILTVFLAGWLIGCFEEALDLIVALAVGMPAVASIGSIAGSWTPTLTIRASR